MIASVPASATPAAYTTVDVAVDGSGHCLNGTGVINCNIYDGKQYVYLNGGPNGTGGLPPGTYFFAVLDPGSQKNPNDGSAGLLSTDAYTDRIFSVASGGVVSNLGTHFFDSANQLIQLMPYNDTSNMGGVYILAICSLANGYPVIPSTCKYDAFKVRATTAGQPGSATVNVCKFWDQDLNHQWNNDEPFIGGWPITPALSGNNNVDITPTTATPTNNTVDSNTGIPGPGFGCVTFTLNWNNNDTNPVTVTFTEGNAPVDASSQSCNIGAQSCISTPIATWTQSAPWDFNANPPALTATTVQVSPNQDVSAPDFGNFYGQDLQVSKTATPTFTRTYNWRLTKTLVSPTGNPVEQSSSNPTITYNVTASQDTTTPFTDSLWKVTGTIILTNPNLFAMSGVGVSDQISDGTNCIVTTDAAGTNTIPSGGVTVPAATGTTAATFGSLTLYYTCTYTAQPASYGSALNPLVNTATATWSQSTYGTPHGKAPGTANFYFNDGSTGNPTRLDYTVQVTDCFNGPCPPPASNTGVLTTLGTLTATDAPPYATHTWTVTENPTITAGTCATFSNTAILTDDTAGVLGVVITTATSANVTICNENTKALTMGFWQNKNGQALIAGVGPSSGTCNLVAYLRSYVPFQDLSSTATCSSTKAPSSSNYTLSVTNYVAWIISLANSAGGGTAMTKGQMLATSLTAYFSENSSNSCVANYPWGTGTNQVGSQGTSSNLACVKYQLNPIHGTENVGIAFNGVPTASDPRYLWQMLLDTSTNWTTFIACTSASCKSNAVLTSDAYNYINNSQANIAP